MTDHSTATAGPAVRYTERLAVPLWWWPIAFGVAGLLAAEIHRAAAGIPMWLPYLALSPIPVWTLLWFGRHRITVTDELQVAGAHLPASFVRKAAVIPASAKSAALGRQLDPAAFVQHRPWIGSMVLLVLDDPDDPAPYWLISTRKPERVLAALGI